VKTERVARLVAAAGLASRRGADELIARGRVTVDGLHAVVGQQVDPATARISVDGVPLPERPATVYLALHKPPGVTSTVRDPRAGLTVLDFVPSDMRIAARRLYPVGRLDRGSEGLLVLTNDGPWAERILHPRYEVEREYLIGLKRPLTPAERHVLEGGVSLEEGLGRLAGLRTASVQEVAGMLATMGERSSPLRWYRAILTQGWRRQLRRMFASVGIPVDRLVRVRIGPLRLDGLTRGEVRALEPEEVTALVAPVGRSTLHGRTPPRRHGSPQKQAARPGRTAAQKQATRPGRAAAEILSAADSGSTAKPRSAAGDTARPQSRTAARVGR